MRVSLINWALLMVLVGLWGTSFMFTAIAVATVDPVSIVFYRLALGAVVLSLVVYARGYSLPLQWRVWAGFFVMSIAGNAMPFFLIAWGQQSVDSGVAGMIMAIMPLLTMVFAHYFVEGETLNRYKLIGFTLGITGVILLLGPVFEGGGRAFWGGLAIFTAASCYAINTILIKRLPRYSPMVGACGVLIMAALVMFPFWLTFRSDVGGISQDVDDQLPDPGGGVHVRRLAAVGTGRLAALRRAGHDPRRYRRNPDHGAVCAALKLPGKPPQLDWPNRRGSQPGRPGGVDVD